MISFDDLSAALTGWRVRNGLPVSQPVSAPAFQNAPIAPPLAMDTGARSGTQEVDIGDEGTFVADADADHDDVADALVDADSLVDESLE